ncbi:MAG: hypothetical protein E7680_00125 [Ruminococcaceae bacterium]|nr:hypothetical protein [Oscillospiraceae bacterium]
MENSVKFYQVIRTPAMGRYLQNENLLCALHSFSAKGGEEQAEKTIKGSVSVAALTKIRFSQFVYLTFSLFTIHFYLNSVHAERVKSKV